MLYLAKSLEHALLVGALRVLIEPFEFVNRPISPTLPVQCRIPMPPIFAVRIRNDDVRRRRKWRRFDCFGDENGTISAHVRSPARAWLRRWSPHALNGFNHVGESATCIPPFHRRGILRSDDIHSRDDAFSRWCLLAMVPWLDRMTRERKQAGLSARQRAGHGVRRLSRARAGTLPARRAFCCSGQTCIAWINHRWHTPKMDRFSLESGAAAQCWRPPSRPLLRRLPWLRTQASAAFRRDRGMSTVSTARSETRAALAMRRRCRRFRSQRSGR